MEKKYFSLFIVLISYLLFSAPIQAAETYTLDSKHTYVLWYIKHMGFSTQVGKWYANGTLILDKEKPINSKVNAVIKIADLNTGLPELDKHLKSSLFFDVKQYPTATYVSNKIEMNGKNAAKVYGILTMHGVSKPVTLDVKFNQSGTNPINNKMTVGFSATASIKRSNFGMTAYLPNLGDDVQLTIEAEAFSSNK